MKPATSIAKVCRILDEFRQRPSMGVSEVAERTGLLPSDIHRILSSLMVFGYVGQDPHSKRYYLGLELLKLGQAVVVRLGVRDVGRPVLCRLAEEAGATASLATFDSHDLSIIFVEQIDSTEDVQIKLRIGARAAPHATGVGKVLCAYLDSETRRKVFEKYGTPRLTSKTVTDCARLERELETVRANGYATDLGEALEGAYCVAAPVRNHHGEVIAAISVSMTVGQFRRWRESQLVRMVTAAAATFSAGLGYVAPEEVRGAAKSNG